MKEALELRVGVRETVPGIEIVPVLASIQDEAALLKSIEALTRELEEKTASLKQAIRDSEHWNV